MNGHERTIKVLLLEDNPRDVALVAALFGSSDEQLTQRWHNTPIRIAILHFGNVLAISSFI